MIDKGASTPVYLQLKNYLKEKIIQKVYLPGQILPPEKELAQRCNISRMTVRQAIGILQNEGLIYKEKGRGTFVARNVIEKQAELLSFSQDMKNRGFQAGSKVLLFTKMNAAGHIIAKLRMEQNEQVFFLKRLRLADNIPMAVEYCYLPCRLFPDIIKFNMENCSLYEIMRNEYFYKLSYAKQILSAGKLSREDAEFLMLKGTAFGLAAVRTLYADNNTPLEFTETYYHPEHYQYSMILTS